MWYMGKCRRVKVTVNVTMGNGDVECTAGGVGCDDAVGGIRRACCSGPRVVALSCGTAAKTRE